MMDWSKSDKEVATAGYESVVRLFNDDGSVPEKGFLLVIDELKRLWQSGARDFTVGGRGPFTSQRSAEGDWDKINFEFSIPSNKPEASGPKRIRKM
jgi:hypothetical protein